MYLDRIPCVPEPFFVRRPGDLPGVSAQVWSVMPPGLFAGLYLNPVWCAPESAAPLHTLLAHGKCLQGEPGKEGLNEAYMPPLRKTAFSDGEPNELEPVMFTP